MRALSYIHACIQEAALGTRAGILREDGEEEGEAAAARAQVTAGHGEGAADKSAATQDCRAAQTGGKQVRVRLCLCVHVSVSVYVQV